MKRWNELGLAAGLVAALALAGTAQAQGASTGSGSTPSQQSGSGSSMGSSDTGATGSSTSGSSGTKYGGTGTGAGSSMGGSSTGSSGSSSMGSSTTGSDQATTGSSTGSTAGSKPLKSDLRDGLEKLHAANQGEIQAGQMALTAAQSPQVKEFAQKMVDEHTQNDQQLTQMAQSMGVDLSGKAFQKKQQQAQSDMKKVQGKTGAAFDRAYMAWQVKDHAQDAKDTASLAKTATKENQPELAEFLTKTHATIQEHHTMAQQIDKVAKQEGKGTSTRQGRTPRTGAGTTGSSTGSSTGMGSGSESPASPDKTDAGSQPSPTGEGHTGAPGSSGTGTSSGTETGGSGSSTSSGSGK